MDAPDIEQQTWLLKDGSIVMSPPIERTATNKRLRVKGTTTSTGVRQLDMLVTQAIKTVAAEQGTDIWLRVETLDSARSQAVAHANMPSGIWNEALTLHLLQDRTSTQARRDNDRSTAVWTYKAKGLPLYAFVFVDLHTQYGGNLYVNTKVMYRSTHERDNDDGNIYWTSFQQQAWSRHAFQVAYYGPENDAIEAFDAKNGHPFGPDADDRPEVMNRKFGTQPRKAVVGMLKRCEAINQLAEIQLPDFRDALNPGWLTFEFLETNYSGSFVQELRDFQQTGPIMDRIKEHYRELMADLELLGIVMPSRPEDTAFEKAVAGDFTELAVGVRPLSLDNADGESEDHQHTVWLNFPSGTVTVSCSQHGDVDAKAQWEIDKFKYEATGELSELLAYARAFIEAPDRKRTRKIIKKRTTELDD
jgi:hypothetical protein